MVGGCSRVAVSNDLYAGSRRVEEPLLIGSARRHGALLAGKLGPELEDGDTGDYSDGG
jgi:hypothetical protein